MESSIEQKIVEGLRGMDKRFEDGELAYLALTSKIELPIRDRLAFMLQKTLGQEGFVVAREWPTGNGRGRVDIAILEKGRPVVLVELKAMYAFNALVGNSMNRFLKELVKDEQTSFSVMIDPSNVYTVLLATAPEGDGGVGLEKVIKYQPWIRRSLKKFGGDATQLVTAASGVIEKKFIGRKIIGHGAIDGGTSLGIKTEVLYWLFQMDSAK